MTSPRRIHRTHKRSDRPRSAVVGAENARKNRERMRQLIAKHKGCCALCGELVTMRDGDPRRATVDHVQPISRGGLDVPANWQLACYACNQAKGATCAASLDAS
jgi:5-methylcytosine-specific restriction endonuclease McrA